MAEQVYYSIITNVGRQLLNDTTSGQPITLTEIAVGDGGGELYTPSPSQMALVNEKWRGNITGQYQDGNYQTVLETVIDTNVGRFTVRELGVFDSNGRLIYIAKLPEIDKITNNSGAVLDLLLKVYITYDSAEKITIVVAETEVEKVKNEIITMVETRLKDISIIKRIPEETIEEICGEKYVGNIVVVGNSISKEDVELLLDDDPDNDPVYDESEYGALSENDILSILNE